MGCTEGIYRIYGFIVTAFSYGVLKELFIKDNQYFHFLTESAYFSHQSQ